jgi:hypothetical protein
MRMVDRYPWAEETTPARFQERLTRAGGRLGVTLIGGEDVFAIKYRQGVVWLEGAGKVRLSRLVWTPFGYEEIDSAETDPQRRAAEAVEQAFKRDAIADLDRGRNPLAILSKRLEEERAAQERAGTTKFQTLDPLTEKVIVSWLRDLDEEISPDAIADLIEAGEHRRGE